MVTSPMLTEGEYASRAFTILADYMAVMGAGKKKGNELVLDGTKLLALIENLVTLMADVEPQIAWPKVVPERLPYN